MKVDFGDGPYLEPDEEPRDSPFYRRIVGTRPIPNTRSGHFLRLACGHSATAFGNLAQLDGRVLCLRCRGNGK